MSLDCHSERSCQDRRLLSALEGEDTSLYYTVRSIGLDMIEIKQYRSSLTPIDPLDLLRVEATVVSFTSL